MKKLIALLLLLGGCYGSAMAQRDAIILRDGMTYQGKIMLVDNDFVTYQNADRNHTVYRIDSRSVYMIHYEKRGNVYFTETGERMTGEVQKIDNAADIIYLIEGREIIAYDIQVSRESISYKVNTAKRTARNTLSKAQVFMILYHDGSREMVNRFELEAPIKPIPVNAPQPAVTTPPAEAAPAAAPKAAPKTAPEAAPKKIEPVAAAPAGRTETTAAASASSATSDDDTQIVFHNVTKGETIAQIAERYNVTAADIIKWNSLPTNINTRSRLQTEKQFMIYVKKL